MSDCYCDYEPATFYNRAVPTARKPHRCEECGGPIKAGEKYESVSALWPDLGGVCTFKTCERCCDIRQWLQNNLPCFCWAHGNMLEDAWASIDEAYAKASDEVRGLRFGFLKRIVAQRQHNKAARA